MKNKTAILIGYGGMGKRYFKALKFLNLKFLHIFCFPFLHKLIADFEQVYPFWLGAQGMLRFVRLRTLFQFKFV